ncbi:YdiK family protein [Lentibacillus daqui]|uniref:YdiK family protein n=1 Tax=Lentibacillus daqui TaxID=2911514 RepID=UPI0022B1BC87|nr:YdiK family protein [Lentibacillus daqui]
MQTSPKIMAIIYFVMGIFFTYIATKTVTNTMWNFSTIVLAIIATLQFGVAIRLMLIHFRLKRKNRKK